MQIKKYQKINVLDAARKRICQIFDDFDCMYLSFSGGKDSTVMLHLVMDEAIKRNRRVGVLLIDLEAQYSDTITHATKIIEMYKNNIDLYWVCVPLKLRNAVTNFEPQWCAWDPEKESIWVRQKPTWAKTEKDLPFFIPKMEFLESKCWVPSWRRMCRVLLRNDYWCKGLGQMQPKSDAHWKYRELVDNKKKLKLTKRNR